MRPKLMMLQVIFVCMFITETHAQSLFTGIWRAGTDGYALYGGLSWSSLVSKWQTLGGQGLRLTDISTYLKNGQRLYNGVWRAGTDGYALYGGVSWSAFVAQWQTLGSQGLRLIDIETYLENNTRLYVGVWRAGTDGYALYGGVNWTSFVAKWQELGAQNLRLVDVATYLSNGVRLYVGVWRAGTDGYALYGGVDWTAFTAKWNELASQNLRLINISSYVENSVRKYLGVWRAGTDGYYLWNGTDWESLVSKWAENGSKNLRLINLETYESSCTDDCLNHVLMPDNLSTGGRETYNYQIKAGTLHCEGEPGTCPLPGPNDYVTYSWPNLQLGTTYYARNSVLFDAKDQIFSLPFSDAAVDMRHNGWLYSDGTWHHAIDYSRNDTKTFKIDAAAPGKVIYIGWDKWSGNTMILSHDVGTKKDVYRTIYMHLQNGPTNDCSQAWTKTVPTLTGANLYAYKSYLNSTGCPEVVSLRNPTVANWGLSSQKINTSLLGTTVTAGQLIAWAGSTGPGGCGCMDTTNNPNTHLHIFFAHKDPTDNHWYFFDPYGIYSNPTCYPTAVNGAITTACARYPVSWKGGNPNYAAPPQSADSSAIVNEAVANIPGEMASIFVSPNPSYGNINVQYNSNNKAGNVKMTIYDATGVPIIKRIDYARSGNNNYNLNVNNLVPGVYYIELNNSGIKTGNKFIIAK